MQLANDGSLQAAFDKLNAGLCAAAAAAGMPAKVSGRNTLGRQHKPLFDAQCLALKRQVHRARGHVRKELEAE